MNKKVLSAILFSALFAGTGTFTSCIDNDEPAGIENLRGAKAELIRAKVAVEQANAAHKLAEAELEKAKAAVRLADARIKEADAAKKEAEAAKAAAQTKEEKARIEAQIAKYQQQIEEDALKHQEAMVNLQINLANAQRSYELALAKIAIAKELCPLEATFELSSLQDAVDYWNMYISGMAGQIESAQKAYDAAVLDVKYYGEHDVEELQIALDDAKATLEKSKADLATYENWLKEDVATKDWRARVDELVAVKDSLEKVKANAGLGSSLAENSEEYKALLKAKEEAGKPAKVDTAYFVTYKKMNKETGKVEDKTVVLYGVEKSDDTEKNDTYLDCDFADVANADSLVADLETAMEKIAEYDDAKNLKGGILYDGKEYLKEFTAEKMDRLDTLAKYGSETSDWEETAEKDVKAWEDALAAFKAGKKISKTTLYSYDEKTSKYTGAYATYLDEMDKAGEETDEGKKALAENKAREKFADKVVEYYNGLPAAQVGIASITLEYTKGKTATKSITTWLSDADYKGEYLTLVEQYFKESGSDLEALWTENTVEKEVLNTTTGLPDTYLNGAFTKWVVLQNENEKDAESIDKDDDDNATTLYGKLVQASETAFGEAAQYVTGDYNNEIAPDGYLLVKPSETDVKNLFFKNSSYDGLGSYGKNLCANDEAAVVYAQNYKDIMKSVEDANAYWEAKYAFLKAKFEAWEAAKKAADKAVEDYKKLNIDNTSDIEQELGAEITRLGNIIKALNKAIKTYYPNGVSGDYSDSSEVGFKAALENIIAGQKLTVRENERTVIEKQKAVDLCGTEVYTTLDEKKEALDNLLAQLEDAQAELDKAVANLERALEIYAETISE